MKPRTRNQATPRKKTGNRTAAASPGPKYRSRAGNLPVGQRAVLFGNALTPLLRFFLPTGMRHIQKDARERFRAGGIIFNPASAFVFLDKKFHSQLKMKLTIKTDLAYFYPTERMLPGCHHCLSCLAGLPGSGEPDFFSPSCFTARVLRSTVHE